MSRPRRLRPANVLRTLADLLRARGITRLYGSACIRLGVLSVAYGLSVWCDGRQLWWHRDGQRTTWPARDPEGAARLLAGLAQDPGSTEQPDRP
jgi:hypothetical protein